MPTWLAVATCPSMPQGCPLPVSSGRVLGVHLSSAPAFGTRHLNHLSSLLPHHFCSLHRVHPVRKVAFVVVMWPTLRGGQLPPMHSVTRLHAWSN